MEYIYTNMYLLCTLREDITQLSYTQKYKRCVYLVVAGHLVCYFNGNCKDHGNKVKGK